MAELPAKRARRVDSSVMWDMDDRRTHAPDVDTDYDRNPKREPYDDDDDGRRDGARDDRRYRSRSRNRRERWRDRSRSRDRRDRDRDKRDWDKDGRETRRDRSLSRDGYYDRRGHPPKGDRYRDRSRSPIRNGNRDRASPPRGSRGDRRNDRRDFRGQANGADSKTQSANRPKDDMDVDIDDIDGEADIEEMMHKSMGFSNFRSTKNTKVPGNNVYGVRKEKKTEYRQYMNRIGGFNQPLSPSR